jgi:hypothetical protein
MLKTVSQQTFPTSFKAQDFQVSRMSNPCDGSDGSVHAWRVSAGSDYADGFQDSTPSI